MNKNSLKIRISALVIVLIIISVVVTSYMATDSATKVIITENENYLMFVADAYGEMVDRHLYQRLHDIAVITDNPVIRDSAATSEQKAGVLREYQSGYGDIYHDIFMVDREGQFVAGSGSMVRDDYSATNWFQQAITKNEIHYEYRESIDLGIHLIVVTKPIVTNSGETIGVVNARMSLAVLDDILGNIPEQFAERGMTGSYPYIIDQNGVIVWHPVEDNISRLNIAQRDDELGYAAMKMIRGERGSGQYTFEGVEKIIGYSPMTGQGLYDGLDWSIAVTLDKDVLLQPVNTVRVHIGLIALLIVVLSGMVLSLYLRKSFRPLHQTVEMLKDIAEGEGDLSRRIEVDAQDEGGQLANYFNLFVDKVEKMSEDILAKANYLNAIPTPVMAIDREMNVVFMNPAAARAVGQTVESARGKKCHSLFNTGHCGTGQCQVVRAMREDGVFTSDTVAQLPSGELPIRYTATPLKDQKGNIVGALEYLIDISEEHRAVATVEGLIEHALAGRLDSRGNPDEFSIAGFQKVVKGMNHTLDAVTQPIKEASAVLQDLAKGNLMVMMTGEYQGDHAEIKNALNHSITTIKAMIREIFETTLTLNQASVNLLQIADTMANKSEEMNSRTGIVSAAVEEISASIGSTASASEETSGNINVIASAVEQMSATIRNLASASEQTSAGVGQVTMVMEQTSNTINNVAESAQEVSHSVGTVATAVKEINISLNEVSKNCEHSKLIADNARSKVDETNDIIRMLNEASRQIGKIVNVISDIADQTNMLALNAAIEAAGAGEAGKGFAVVANEVKELAKQTAEATEEIGDQIENMQIKMSGAVGSVEKIDHVVEEMTKITNTIAAAVTEQSATVGEISKSVIMAAEKVNSISKDINDVAINSHNVTMSGLEASKGVKEIARSASELSVASSEVARNTEQASAKVSEVAKAATEVSKGTNDISKSILGINRGSNETALASVETNEAAKQLLEISNKLEHLMKQFVIE